MSTQALAEQGKQVALQWLINVENSINGFEYCWKHGVTSAPYFAMISEAFRKHFQLVTDALLLTPNKRLVDDTLLKLIRANFKGVKNVLNQSFKYFKYVTTATADPAANHDPAYTYGGLSGAIHFNGDVFKDFNKATGTGFGPLSRGAMVLHESIHIVDTQSGPPNHIYEHEAGYDSQRADQAIHNASSYASFAQHVSYGRDTRFGAGVGKTKF
jgi:hypothetical protein